MGSDVRQGARLFTRSPAFTSIALLVIALGICATTTIYSLVNAVLLRSLPYGEAERLVYMWTPFPHYSDLPREFPPPYADLFAWREMSRSFSGITAVRQRMAMLNGHPVRIGTAEVLGNFFQTLKAVPRLGRAIDADDDHPERERVAVIGDALWRSRFAGNADVLGKVVQIDGQSYSVVGVMAKAFTYPHGADFPGSSFAGLERTDIWIPAALSLQQQSVVFEWRFGLPESQSSG